MGLIVEIITPKGKYATLDVASLTVKLTSGYRTILKDHTPLIGSLDYAPMHVHVNNKPEYYALHGGAINITKEKVILICNAIEHVKDIDIDRAKRAKERAETRLKSKDEDIDIKRAMLALKRALARIETYSKR